MSLKPWRIPRKARDFISYVLIAIFLIAITGVPRTKPITTSSERHPCESCACGCSSAEFCWDKCCCRTDSEKLEWARKNRVDPPEFLVARAGKAASVASETKHSCCAKGKSARTETCGSSATCEQSEHHNTSSPVDIGIIRWEDAAKCRGIQWIWALLASALVNQTTSPSLFSHSPFLYLLVITDVRVATRCDVPDPPVP